MEHFLKTIEKHQDFFYDDYAGEKRISSWSFVRMVIIFIDHIIKSNISWFTCKDRWEAQAISCFNVISESWRSVSSSESKSIQELILPSEKRTDSTKWRQFIYNIADKRDIRQWKEIYVSAQPRNSRYKSIQNIKVTAIQEWRTNQQRDCSTVKDLGPSLTQQMAGQMIF